MNTSPVDYESIVCTKLITYAIDLSLGKIFLILIISKKVTKNDFKTTWFFIVFESLKKSLARKLIRNVSTMFKGQCNINLLEYIIWNFHYATLNHYLKKSVKFVSNMESIFTKKSFFSECEIFVFIIRALVKAEVLRCVAILNVKDQKREIDNPLRIVII